MASTNSEGATTALMAAINGGHAVVVTWLLGEGGVVGTLEVRGEKGNTAFVLACTGGQLECVELLARAGCNMDAKTVGTHDTRRMTTEAIAQRASHAAVRARVRELRAERAAATQRREAEKLMAAGEHRAAAALLAKLLRQAPGDTQELECLLAEAEQQREEADAAADVLARAAEAELLAMETGEQAAGSSKAGRKKEKRKRQQERARAAKAAAEAAAARAREPEPEPAFVAVLQPQRQPQLQPQDEVDAMEALLSEHLRACRVHELDLGAPCS